MRVLLSFTVFKHISSTKSSSSFFFFFFIEYFFTRTAQVAFNCNKQKQIGRKRSEFRRRKHNMENPHEQVQANILSRIIGNVKRLNESVAILNQELVTINNRNKNLEIMGAICDNYHSSVQFNLEATNNKKPPL
ncbi:Dad4p [Saccharomyces cerevisiae VL3]|nr:Dad4p [Saccharomyces cerevisiae VL3]